MTADDKMDLSDVSYSPSSASESEITMTAANCEANLNTEIVILTSNFKLHSFLDFLTSLVPPLS